MVCENCASVSECPRNRMRLLVRHCEQEAKFSQALCHDLKLYRICTSDRRRCHNSSGSPDFKSSKTKNNNTKPKGRRKKKKTIIVALPPSGLPEFKLKTSGPRGWHEISLKRTQDRWMGGGGGVRGKRTYTRTGSSFYAIKNS